MKTLTIGSTTYRVLAIERDARWVAHAERMDNGDRFGVEFSSPSFAEESAKLPLYFREN